MECLIVKVHSLFINLNIKGGVSLNHGASLRFVLLLAFQTCRETFQVKNNVRSAPVSSAVTHSCTEAITCLPQIVTYVAVDKGMELKGEQR